MNKPWELTFREKNSLYEKWSESGDCVWEIYLIRAAQLKLAKWMITEQRPYEELVAEVKAALEETK